MLALLDRERQSEGKLKIGRSDVLVVGEFPSTDKGVHDARRWSRQELAEMAAGVNGYEKIAPVVTKVVDTRGPEIEDFHAEALTNARQAAQGTLRLHELDELEFARGIAGLEATANSPQAALSAGDLSLEALEAILAQRGTDSDEKFVAGILVSPRRHEVTVFAADNHEMNGAGPVKGSASLEAQHGHGSDIMFGTADKVLVVTAENNGSTLDQIRRRTDTPVIKAVAGTFHPPRQDHHGLPGAVRDAFRHVGNLRHHSPVSKPVHA